MVTLRKTVHHPRKSSLNCPLLVGHWWVYMCFINQWLIIYLRLCFNILLTFSSASGVTTKILSIFVSNTWFQRWKTFFSCFFFAWWFNGTILWGVELQTFHSMLAFLAFSHQQKLSFLHRIMVFLQFWYVLPSHVLPSDKENKQTIDASECLCCCSFWVQRWASKLSEFPGISPAWDLKF